MKSSLLFRRAAHFLHLAPPPDVVALGHSSQRKEIVVVRRGLSENYYFFMGIFAKHNNVEVIIDRRTGERRHLPREVPTDQRRSDRRSDLKAWWIPREDFFVPRDKKAKER
jgi:hypothetical protein